MRAVNGLHHITAIAGPAQENLDFYAGVLGMRLVKRSVNQDDPGTYHLFYADAEGHPGSDLTFFPWAQMAPPRLGHGLAVEVGLAVPPASLSFWAARLERYGAQLGSAETRFGEQVLPLVDPHGLRLVLVGETAPRAFTPWEGSTVAAEHQVRGLHGARAWERDLGPSEELLAGALGMERLGSEGGWTRWRCAGGPGVIDLQERRDERRGAWGVGSVHHLAWRVDDPEHQRAVRAQVIAAGGHPTEEIDRFWFRSVYFKEPGGVLFELATDGPGFAVDEDPAHLGETLVLPPWLEAHRRDIEGVLPPLRMPPASPSS
jgi:glyoxalase family protein